MARACLGRRAGAHRLCARAESDRALLRAKGKPKIEDLERSSSEAMVVDSPPKIDVRRLDFFYGKSQALKGVNLRIPANAVTAIIGPSGCGKTTLLRTINRDYALFPDQ